MNNASKILRDMVEDYRLEREECEDAIERLEDKIAMYKNRKLEIDEMLLALTEKHGLK